MEGSRRGRRARALLGTLGLVALTACARPVIVTPPTAPPTTPPLRPPSVGLEETGHASWYGAQHHGRRTASGEAYDMHDLTAAHRTLPMGTRLMVTDLQTGQTVEVRVNDRGPFVDGRVLDLSYGAARQLRAVGRGVFPVRLKILALPGAGSSGSSGAGRAPAFTVQVGAFASRASAEHLRDTLERDERDVVIEEVGVSDQTHYRVRVGSFPDRATAENVARRLAQRGYRPIVVER